MTHICTDSFSVRTTRLLRVFTFCQIITYFLSSISGGSLAKSLLIWPLISGTLGAKWTIVLARICSQLRLKLVRKFGHGFVELLVINEQSYWPKPFALLARTRSQFCLVLWNFYCDQEGLILTYFHWGKSLLRMVFEILGKIVKILLFSFFLFQCLETNLLIWKPHNLGINESLEVAKSLEESGDCF